MRCSRCQHENPAGAKFCLECGAPMAARCPSCGTDLPPSAKFCLECGRPTGERTGERSAPASYTPKHLAEKILTSRSALEGERKHVTVLFADVKGSMDLAEGLDPEEWHRIMDRFFQILGEGVHRFEGTINQFTGDGIMALFGAPIAHEDHAQRACFAALHLKDELRRFGDELKRSRGVGLSVRMGLNSGEVVVGKIGDDLRMDYTAHGHTVGIADRMQKLADPGTAYLSGSLAELVSGYFALRDLGAFELKGVRDPVHAFELQGVGEMATRLDASRARGLSRFIGRQRELGVLEETLEAVRGGSGRIVAVVGEAGVGKSRLGFEFAEQCRTAGFEVHSAHAVSYGKAVPFFPVLGLLRSYFGVGDQDRPEEARRKVAGTLLLRDPAWKESLPLVFDFLGVVDPDHPAPEIDPESRQRMLFEVFRGITASGTGAPKIILVEDLHWLDAGSEAFLEQLAKATRENSTLLLLNYRPEYDDAWLRGAEAQQIQLRPLGDPEIAELLSELLGADPSAHELQERIRSRAGGNPFFVEEVVRSLVETETLVGTPGAYRLVEPLETFTIPPTVHAILAARIDRLEERQKEVLQAAAVIGKEFSESLLADTTGLAPDELSSVLGALETSEFIYLQRLYPRKAYAFKHPLTQDVVYGSQLADRRARIHASVARAIEAQGCGCDRLEECTPLLAHHFELAGDAENAAGWHLQAGRRAMMVDPNESLRHYRKALELLESIPDSPETIALSVTARAAILSTSAFVPVSQEEIDRVFAEGKALAKQSQDRRALAVLLSASGAAQAASGDADRALEHAQRANELARETGDLEFEASLRPALTFAYYAAGWLREGLEYGDELEARLRSAGQSPVEEEGHFMSDGFRAMMITHMGRLGEAEQALTRALRVAAEVGKSFSWMLSSLVDNAYYSGQSEGALAHARAAMESAERYGSPYFNANAYRALGLAHVLNGEWNEAIPALRQGLSIVRDTRSALHLQAPILAQLAEAYLGVGDEERAVENADEAVTTARQNRTRVWECRALLAKARVLRETRGLDAADEIIGALAELSDLITETGAESYTPFVHLERGRLALLSGDRARSQAELLEARRLFEQMGATGHAAALAEIGQTEGPASGEPVH